MDVLLSPNQTPTTPTTNGWAQKPKQARIKVVDYFTMKHLGYLCARLPSAVCSPEDVDKALTIEFPFTTNDTPRDKIKLEKSFKRPKDEAVFLCLLDGPKAGDSEIPACYPITASTLAGEAFQPYDKTRKPQLNCWSLQGVLDCDDPELQALAKGGPGLGFAWLSFLLNQHEVRPPRGLDDEPVHESKAAVLGVPQVILKSVPSLEEGSPRVRLILEPVV